jgi:hypothetical protein
MKLTVSLQEDNLIPFAWYFGNIDSSYAARKMKTRRFTVRGCLCHFKTANYSCTVYHGKNTELFNAKVTERKRDVDRYSYLRVGDDLRVLLSRYFPAIKASFNKFVLLCCLVHRMEPSWCVTMIPILSTSHTFWTLITVESSSAFPLAVETDSVKSYLPSEMKRKTSW